MHLDLLAAKGLIYEQSGLVISDYKEELESKEYGAVDFKLNNLRVKFRAGKITPTKAGLFVTLWKRIGSGPILPYDIEDPFDLVVISVRSSQYFGQFVFPKNVLQEKGIISKEGKGGKRAMRIYPPWDTVDSKQAKKTKEWQGLYFLQIDKKTFVDDEIIRKLFLK